MAVTRRKGRKKPFMADMYIDGVKKESKSFSTAAEAYKWHDAKKAAYESGQIKAEIKSGGFTFGDCIKAYMGHSEGYQKLRMSSQQSMEARMPHFLESPIVHTKMADFTDLAVDEWFDWILKHPTAKNPGRKSFKIELKYLTSILNWYRNYKNSQFVVPIVKKHRDRAKFKKVKPRRKDYFIRPEDIKPWVNWLECHRSDPVYYRLAKFLLQTGTRVGEGSGVCWDVVDLERGEIYITRTMSWDHWTRKPYVEDRVKTEDSDAIINMTPDLIQMFRKIKAERELRKRPDDQKESSYDLVFVNLKGGMLRYNAITSAFNAGFKALELPWRATHICRHTQGTIGLMANNGNIAKVQATLRQGDRKTTEGYAKAIACLDKSTVINAAKVMGFEEAPEEANAAAM